MRGAMTGSAGPAIGTRVVDTLAALRPLAPFFCLYVTFGATLGFLSGGAPLILRARGVELAEVGLLVMPRIQGGGVPLAQSRSQRAGPRESRERR